MSRDKLLPEDALPEDELPEGSRRGRGAQISAKARANVEDPEFFGVTPGASGGRSVVRGGLNVAEQRAAERAAEQPPPITEGEPGLGPPEEGLLATGEPAAGPSEPRTLGIVDRGAAHPPEPIDTRQPGGKGGISGTLTGTIGPEVPAELGQALAAALTRSAQLEALGHQARADALGIEVDILTENKDLLENHFEPTIKQYDEILTQAENEALEIDQLIEIAKSDRINPGQFFENVGGAGRFAAAIAMGAGAMAQIFAGGGGPSTAFRIIKNAIDRNVRAQHANMLHNRALIQHQSNFTHTLRALAQDRANYGNYVRIGLTAMAAANVNIARAALGESLHQMAALDVYNRLDASLHQARINAITASRTKAVIKFKSLSQLSAARAALGAGQGGQAPGRPIAARGKGQGRAPKPKQGAISATVVERLQRLPANASPQEIADAAARELQNTISQNPGMTRQQMQQERDRVSAAIGGIEGKGAPAKKAFDSKGVDRLLPVQELDLLPGGITVGGRKLAFRKTALFNEKKAKEAVSEVSTAANNVHRAERVAELLTIASRRGVNALTKHIRTINGETFFFPPSDPQDRVAVSQLDNDLTVLVQTLRNLGGQSRNAVNTMGEFDFMTRLVGDRADIATQIVEAIAQDGNLREATFLPVLNLTRELFDQAQDQNGLRLVESE